MEELYKRLSGNEINLDHLYELVSARYFLEAELIQEPDLTNIKIMNLFQAANYLDKISKSSSKFRYP